MSHVAIASGRNPKSTCWNLNTIVFFVELLGLWVPGGTPIAFSFSTATLAYPVLTTHAPLSMIVSRMGEGIANLVPRSVLRNALLFVLLGAMFLVPGISGAKPLTWRRSRPLSSPKARAARAAEQQHARQGGPSCALM